MFLIHCIHTDNSVGCFTSTVYIQIILWDVSHCTRSPLSLTLEAPTFTYKQLAAHSPEAVAWVSHPQALGTVAAGHPALALKGRAWHCQGLGRGCQLGGKGPLGVGRERPGRSPQGVDRGQLGPMGRGREGLQGRGQQQAQGCTGLHPQVLGGPPSSAQLHQQNVKFGQKTI